MFYSQLMRGIGCCIAVVAGTLLAAPVASAVTFGADLNRPANNPYTCSDFLFGGGPTTCSAESINPTTGESGFPPAGDGVVTQVRVKVGAITGPMQIVVEEALRQDNPSDPGHPTYICCKAVAASHVFTPAADDTTPVNVNLNVKQDLTPNGAGVYVDQHLALSVLSPNVPIPASLDPNASVGLWFPAWQVGEERLGGSFGTSGGDILFNADWQPVGPGGGGGGGGGGPPGGGAESALSLAEKTARVSANKALLELLCNLTTACGGTLALQNQQNARAPFAERAAKRATTYARASFEIPAGQTKTVKAKLKRAGKQLLKNRKQAKVWVNVELDGGGLVAPFKVKLKR